LAGIYVTMTNDETYGKEASFGLMDQLAQIYDYIPDGAANNRSLIYTYNTEPQGYRTKSRLASIWGGSYNIIANINNLLKWLDNKGKDVIKNDQKRNMIYGEALAIRAYIHFDLLRGWGPMTYPLGDAKNNLSIPYRTLPDNSKQPLLPAKDILDKIIADLNAAEEYLSFESKLNLLGWDTKDRRFRFNYHAIKALKARIYCYANMPKEAIENAQYVIDNSGLSLLNNNDTDPIFFKETIFAINMNKMRERLISTFSEGPNFTSQYYCSTNTLNSIFEVTGTSSDVDMRAKHERGFFRYNDKQTAITRKYIRNDDNVIPLIRLPEMYYILCEMSSLEDAPEYINKIRNKRGYSTSTNYTSFKDNTERINMLEKEYRKEFYAEGQYFYFLKNHGFTTFINCPIDNFGEEQYVFPIPDNEKSYGWTDVSENVSNN
jgi:SusD family.